MPGAPAGDALAAMVAGQSFSGTAVSGEPFCTYYGTDGSFATAISGSLQRSGTWSADGQAICLTGGGYSNCSQFDFLPTGGVTITDLEGSGAFPVSASATAGNTCGV
ncbi:MAG: hypothetical protein R3F55_07565 [Alphaproteobacteria bacterium]